MNPNENQQPPVIPPINPQALPQPHVVTPTEELDARAANNQKIAKTWFIESVFINLFAGVIILLSVLSFLSVFAPTPTSSGGTVDSKSIFFAVLIYGIPFLFGLLILRRSDMARRIIITFAGLNVVLQLIPFFKVIAFNWVTFIFWVAVIIFLTSDKVRKHF